MVKIKICGITRLDDALFAAELGVDAVGFVFYRKSPRFIAPVEARRIIEKLPPSVCPVGVFVNPGEAELKMAIEESGIRGVQLHGEEEPELVKDLKMCIIKTFKVEKEVEEERMIRWKVAKAFLIEGRSSKGEGGVGASFNYRIIKPYTERYRIIVAGGLTPENVGEVVRDLTPFGVDVSSGVEVSQGVKSKKLMEEFVRNARSAG